MKQVESRSGFTFGGSQIEYQIVSDYDEGKRYDTQINFDGVRFSVSGAELEEFKKDFEALINRYFI